MALRPPMMPPPGGASKPPGISSKPDPAKPDAANDPEDALDQGKDEGAEAHQNLDAVLLDPTVGPAVTALLEALSGSKGGPPDEGPEPASGGEPGEEEMSGAGSGGY